MRPIPDPGAGRAQRLLLLLLLLFFLPEAAPAGAAAVCRATGRAEASPADVHAARMEAKAAAGAFDFSSGAFSAARECAELLSRLSSVQLGAVPVPDAQDVLEALRKAGAAGAYTGIEEVCRYTASTASTWVRSQTGILRAAADRTASELVRAPVHVTNPSLEGVTRAYARRLRRGLPGYADLPSLRRLP